ncbi:MAG: DMT family transporter, partial [Acidimicrobiia bacterium]
MTNPLRDFVWEPGEESSDGRPLTRPMVYVLLATSVVILGLNWPIMATGVQSISALWMGAFRVVGGAVTILLIAGASRNLRIPPRNDLPIIASLAVFRLAAVFTLVFTALELLPANQSAVVVWTASLWTVPIAAVFLGERISKQRWVGVALGVVGVVILFRPWALDWNDPLVTVGHGLLLLAA